MEEDIKILEHMRDNIYGAMQFEDDYQVSELEEKEFNALNLAIKHLRKIRLIKNNYIPKSLIKEKIEEFKKLSAEIQGYSYECISKDLKRNDYAVKMLEELLNTKM